MGTIKINTLKGLIAKANRVMGIKKKRPKKHVAKKPNKKTKETPIESDKESHIIDITI